MFIDTTDTIIKVVTTHNN